MFEEFLKLKGEVEFIKKSADGTEERFKIDNLIVNRGRTIIANRLVANTITVPATIRLGSNATAVVATDTALIAETHSGAVTLTFEADFTARSVAHFSFAEAVQVREAGLFNGDAAGVNMISRVNPVLDFLTGDTLQVIWRLTVS